jgi:mono/diheme cytochrome c family protein
LKKSNIVIFAIFALIFVVAIPFIAISKEGEEDSGEITVAASDQEAKELFQTNCGSCHTLAAAGTDGVVGPNLDDLLGAGTTDPEANTGRVLDAIHQGIAGRMPAGILGGEQAKEVASFVSRNAGQ